MSEVKRYDLSLPTNAKNFGMRLSENGCWVAHESYAALEAERDQLRAELAALRASIAALAERWMEQQAAYPNSEEGKHAAAAVRLCATELRQLGEGNSAAAQEGL